MSYTAPNRLLLPMRHSIDTIADSGLHSYTLVTTSRAWPSANLAIYVPVTISCRVVVMKLWFSSGTTGTGNVDMGLYDAAGVAVVSATNAAKVADGTEQVFDVTDTTVGPGIYYIGLSSDSSTDTFYGTTPAAPIPLAQGVLTEASAYPLPATATFAADQTLAFIPTVGLLLEATVA